MLAASDTVIEVAIGAVVLLVALAMVTYLLAQRRDRVSVLRRFRVGVFFERDLLDPTQLPPEPEPWPELREPEPDLSAPTEAWQTQPIERGNDETPPPPRA